MNHENDLDAGISSRNSVDLVIQVYKKNVDATLIRENLTKTHEERILRLQELQRFTDELERAGRALRETDDRL